MDALNRKLYYVSPDRKSLISEATYLSSGEVVEGPATTLVRLPSSQITSMAVDPESNTVFWADSGDKIERIAAGEREVLFRGLNNPTDLTFDPVLRSLFWFEAGNVMKKGSLEEGDLETIFINSRPSSSPAYKKFTLDDTSTVIRAIDQDGGTRDILVVKEGLRAIWPAGDGKMFYQTSGGTVMEYDLVREGEPKPILRTTSPVSSFTTQPTQPRPLPPPPYLYSNIPNGLLRTPLGGDQAPGSMVRQDGERFVIDRSANMVYYFKKDGDYYQLFQEPADFDKNTNSLDKSRNVTIIPTW